MREVGESFELSRHEDRWLALGDSLVGFAVDDNAASSTITDLFDLGDSGLDCAEQDL